MEDQHFDYPFSRPILDSLLKEDNPDRIKKILDPYPQTKRRGLQTVVTKQNDTIMHFAFRLGRVRVIEECMKELKKGATLYTNNFQESPLVWSTFTDAWFRNNIFPALLSNFSQELESIDFFENNLLHHIINTMNCPGLQECGNYYFNCFLDRVKKFDDSMMWKNLFGISPFQKSSRLQTLDIFQLFVDEVEFMPLCDDEIEEINDIKAQVRVGIADRLQKHEFFMLRDILLDQLPDSIPSPSLQTSTDKKCGETNRSFLSLLDEYGLDFFDGEHLKNFEAFISKQDLLHFDEPLLQKQNYKDIIYTEDDIYDPDALNLRYEGQREVEKANYIFASVPVESKDVKKFSNAILIEKFQEYKKVEQDLIHAQNLCKGFVPGNVESPLVYANDLNNKKMSCLFELDEALKKLRVAIMEEEDRLNRVGRLGRLAELILESELPEVTDVPKVPEVSEAPMVDDEGDDMSMEENTSTKLKLSPFLELDPSGMPIEE